MCDCVTLQVDMTHSILIISVLYTGMLKSAENQQKAVIKGSRVERKEQRETERRKVCVCVCVRVCARVCERE